MSNFVKKFVSGLVEDSEAKSNIVESNTAYIPNDNISTVVEETCQSSNIDTSTLCEIEEIYNDASLTNFEKSIYKVAEIVNALPDSIATETKKESVKKMLGVTGLTIEEIENDANQRLEVLKNAMNKSNDETAALIEESEKLIEEYNAKIAEYHQKIESKKMLQEEQNKIITEEIKVINEIQEFI